MNINREVLADYHEKLTVSLSKNDYWSKVNGALKTYGKRASIKGFRPGKVPAGIIKKMYGNQIMSEEIFNFLSSSLQDFFKEENLGILGNPIAIVENWPILDIKSPTDYDFEYEIGIMPEFEVAMLENAETAFPMYKVLATDENINEEIAKQQKRHGSSNMLEEDANVEEGDSVWFKFVEIMPKNEDGEGREPIIRENPIPTDMLTEKGKKAILGMAIGDSKKINIFDLVDKPKEEVIKFILQATEEEQADLNDKFQIEISKITRVTPAELDQDFFAKVVGIGEAATEDEFKAKIKAQIEDANNYYTKQHLHTEFVNTLMETTEITLPISFLEKFFVINQKEPMPEDKFNVQFPQYIQATKWNLIRNKIATDNELKVEQEELDGYIYSDVQRQLMQYAPQLMGNPEMMEGFVQNMKKDKQYVEEAFLRILDDKIFATLEEKVTVDEQEVTAPEYEAIVKAANEKARASREQEELISDAITIDTTEEVKPDKLNKIEGIGPKIASVLIDAGIKTFNDLANSNVEKLKEILAENKLARHIPDTWPQQAKLAAEGKWDELKVLQDELDGGKVVK